MKSRLIAAAVAVALLCISSQANAAGFLSNILGGGYGNGCCDVAPSCGCEKAPACGCERPRCCHQRCHRSCGCRNHCGCAAPVQAPSCGCEKTCGCDRGCHRQRCCGGWLQGLFSHHGCGCHAAPKCGCEMAPACGYETAPVQKNGYGY
jgi:hypothetical protein